MTSMSTTFIILMRTMLPWRQFLTGKISVIINTDCIFKFCLSILCVPLWNAFLLAWYMCTMAVCNTWSSLCQRGEWHLSQFYSLKLSAGWQWKEGTFVCSVMIDASSSCLGLLTILVKSTVNANTNTAWIKLLPVPIPIQNYKFLKKYCSTNTNTYVVSHNQYQICEANDCMLLSVLVCNLVNLCTPCLVLPWFHLSVQSFLPRHMECRLGLTMRILSVCLSVHLFVKRVHCDKTEEKSSTYLYHAIDHLA